MPLFPRTLLSFAWLTALLALPGASHAELEPNAAARLAALHQTPQAAGALVYRGAVFELGRPQGAALFNYERRVAATEAGLTASHITHNLQRDTIIVETAQFSPAYDLQRFDAINQQQGYSGTVRVSPDGRQLAFSLNDNGKLSTATEDVSEPVVSGPSLHGFIAARWEALATGRPMAVRMIVLAKKQTYGFEIRQEAQANGQTSFVIAPSSLLVRMAIAPLRVVFDNATRNLVRYEGRVPPMQALDGRLKDLDARVDYTMVAARYR